MTLDASIALTRFGLGATPGDIARVGTDPRGFLRMQTSEGDASLLDGDFNSMILEAFDALRARRSGTRGRQTDAARAERRSAFNRARRSLVEAEVRARLERAVDGQDGFRERMVLFWANHFTVSAADGPALVLLAGAFEREAIRPHVMGKFADMLLAAAAHPAMLVYLDNVRSTGPNSPRGAARDAGLNENLAREILELHTLGVDGGYTQQDVLALANILTGWTIDRETQTFRFARRMHEPGSQTLLGRTYSQQGVGQGRAALRDLAARPETARFVAKKLATHMHSDEPPASLVGRLERAFRDTDGDLGAVSRALIDAPEMWEAQQRKIKTPYEFVVSALRAVGWPPRRDLANLRRTLAGLSQAPFSAPSPAGWPDTGPDWTGPGAVKRRLDWSTAVARMIASRRGDPARRGDAVLGALLSEDTRFALAGAESAEQGLTLLLMCPEFQRRCPCARSPSRVAASSSAARPSPASARRSRSRAQRPKSGSSLSCCAAAWTGFPRSRP